jgi:serine/threonine-protein kinase TTK/MPS1
MKAIPDPNYAIEFPTYTTPVDRGVPQPDGSTSPPRKLDHLKRKVRSDLILCMKSCLVRGPKERAAIPELLDQDWLTCADCEYDMSEPLLDCADEAVTANPSSTPEIKDLLKEDETVINPYYMRQLLEYGISLGANNPKMSEEQLDVESRVCRFISLLYPTI